MIISGIYSTSSTITKDLFRRFRLSMKKPLGSRADSIPDLDGYRIEAIDIIMALGVFRRFVTPEETVSEILNQAFDLSLKPTDCMAPARMIQLILGAG
jgi:hypothetical protein